MANLQPVRGTHDLLPEDMERHRQVEETARTTAELYGFSEVATPIFEFTDVFARTLGDTSDIVTKEMYTFETKGGERLTLRPEGTAGIARAFISNGLAQQVPVKFFYKGPMFRHERPQKGRQRQFHQIGVELIGVDTPQADIEVIALAAQILERLELAGEVKLELNSLGDTASRQAFRAALVEYLAGHADKLSDDSRMRLERNPLRILDSKDKGDRAVIAGAPDFRDFLNDESRDFFKAVIAGLERLGIGYELNPHLVRGLDYYCHTAFEFTTDALGAQGTVLAGGRYDGLIKQMGGPEMPGVGWAAGIERLAMLTPPPSETIRTVAVVPVGAEGEEQALVVTQNLRQAGIAADLAYSGNTGRRMKRANKLNARAAVMIGEDELVKGKATVRNLDTGEQVEVAFEDLIPTLRL